MDEFDYNIVVELYTKKTITTVANDLYVSQPALTKRLKKIEEECGTKLFNRTKKGVTFTEHGKLLYEYSKKNLENKEELFKAFAETKQTNKVLEIGCSTAFALCKLPKLINEFTGKYKDSELHINSEPSYKVYKQLIEREIDIAIIREDYPWDGMKIKLTDEPVCLIYNKKVSLKELNDIPAVTYISSPTLQKKMDKWIKENNISLASGTYNTNDIASAYDLVKKGVGWSIMPSIIFDDFDGYIEKLKVNNEDYTRSTYLYYNIECENYKNSANFINFIINKYKTL